MFDEIQLKLDNQSEKIENAYVCSFLMNNVTLLRSGVEVFKI